MELFSPREKISIYYFIDDLYIYPDDCKIEKLEPSDSKMIEFLMITDNDIPPNSIRFKIETGSKMEYFITKLLKYEALEKIVKK